MELKENILFAGRYRLLEYKGQGSFGEVWKTFDEFTGQEVAVKIYIALDESGLKDFTSEYTVAYGLNHPNLIHANHFDVCERRPYLVMPYCSKGSAGSLIGNADEATLWRFLHDVSAGLAYLHKQEPPLVHQDIKPHNVLITATDDFAITDFGISTRVRSTLQRSSRNVTSGGTIAYMGPERFSSKPEPIKASDMWSLGASLYEMATGTLPFCGQGGSLQKVGADLPELGDEYSAELNAVMQACLSQEPWLRPTAEELVEYTTARQKGRAGEKPWEKRGESDNPKPKDWLRYVVIAISVVIGIVLGVTLLKGCDKNKKEKVAEVVDTVSEEGITDSTVEVEDVIAEETDTMAVLEEMFSTINGHEYVDLGLSVKWATCNVGASSPEEYGNYYAWGEVSPKDKYTDENYKWYDVSKKLGYNKYFIKKYNTDIDDGKVDNKTILDSRDDAATMNWGDGWRIPTYDEWNELRKQCDWSWITKNGTVGYEIKSKNNGNSIFLPAAGMDGQYGINTNGHYWASTLDFYSYEVDDVVYSGYSNGNANSVDFNIQGKRLDCYVGRRENGRSIRPVVD